MSENAVQRCMERLAPEGRRVFVCAQQEASAMRHAAIGTQHFLVGMAVVGGPAAEALAALGATAEVLREQAARSGRRKLRPVKGAPQFDEEVKNLVADALREAFAGVSERIGLEHMLLAAYRRDNAAAHILAALGVDRDRVAASLRPVLGEPYFVHKDPMPARDKFTPAAERALAGLGVALTALRGDAAAEQPRKALPGGAKIVLPSYVLAHALHEASDVGQRYIGTEHLVLATFSDSRCADFLGRYGITRHRFQEAVVQWRGRVTEPELSSDVLIPQEFFDEFGVSAE